jgi:hypothetical protein
LERGGRWAEHRTLTKLPKPEEQTMAEFEMRIEKAKLPKGMSHPLRSSFLMEALHTGSITVAAHLKHIRSGPLFEAFFWPIRPGVRYERLYIRAAAVPSEQKRLARRHLEDKVVGEFVRWVQGILLFAPKSPVRREEQHFWRELPKPPLDMTNSARMPG